MITNKTRRKTLAAESSVLRSMPSMALGAMFRGLRGKGLVFVWHKPDTIAITNLFVPEAIDILWLDDNLRVVDLHKRFPSWSLRTANKRPARYVVELPAGTIEASTTAIGDVLAIKGL